MTATSGGLNVTWNHGTPRRARVTEPRIQVHQYDERTFILRQSKSVNYEAPFIFLLLGEDRALLLDSGATASAQLFPLRESIDRLLPPADDYQLVVAHSHGHQDHVSADVQFSDRPNTVVVGRDLQAVQEFFGFGAHWPDEIVHCDLGGRSLEIIGSPGHHRAAITVYDPRTGLLLTGDTVLPGRLYAFDYPAFLATLDRLVAFADTRVVTHVFGCHVEMSVKPGRAYPLGAMYQPHERAPQLTVDQLRAIRDAAYSVKDRRGMHPFDDFIICNEPRQQDMIRLIVRGLAHKLTGR